MKFLGIFDECCTSKNIQYHNEDCYKCKVCNRIFIHVKLEESDRSAIKRIAIKYTPMLLRLIL